MTWSTQHHHASTDYLYACMQPEQTAYMKPRELDVFCNVQTVRLWDRKTHICRHILQLPSCPSAVYLLSDDVTVVTCVSSCSVWKGSRCLRTICPILLGRSHILCTTVSENLLFLAAHGTASTVSPIMPYSMCCVCWTHLPDHDAFGTHCCWSFVRLYSTRQC